MDNLITVVSLQGQAWAVAQDGSRRELQVGDTIAANEMVVTAEGAQIDLQFANNQVLSLIGEQEMPVQALQDAQATPLSSPLTLINTPATTSMPASQGSHVLKEGHNFVQLVRIAEIIEADGFTPLTVARIQEIIKPLGMVLPERDFEDDRWKDNYSRNDDLTPPELQGGQLEALQNFDADMINLDLSSRFKDAVSGSDITYVAENLPKGLTINPKTGVISGKIDSSASQGGNTGTQGEYNVTITVTDPSGNSSNHNFIWTVTNPVPKAENDDNSVGEDDLNVMGNVLTGEGSTDSDAAKDTDPDGDVLTVIGVAPGAPGVPPETGVSAPIKGEYGSLTLNPNGGYTYTPDPEDPRVNALKDTESLTDTFTYTMTDSEGGTDTATLIITIVGRTDGPPKITPIDGNGDDANDVSSIGQVTVKESGLIGGSTEGGKEHINTGSITITTPDGLKSIVVGGVAVSLAELLALNPADSSTHIEIDTPQGKLTLTGFDSTTHVGGVPTLGDLHYSYELEEVQNTPADPTDPSVGLNNTETITLEVTDAGGATAPGSLIVNILDDVPVIEANNGFVVPNITVDETDLGTSSGAISFAGAFKTPVYGADGAASTDPLLYSLVVDNTVASGFIDTATGEKIVLSVNGVGVAEGRTENSNELAFTVSVNTDGEVTLKQERSLNHPDKAYHDDAMSLPSGALSLKATVTDGDADKADASISLGDKLIFKDDGPAIDADTAFVAPSVIVDETTLGTPSAAIDFAGAFKTPVYGADGAASTNPLVYSLEVGSVATGLTDTATGETIVLSVNAAGEVEGRTAISDDLAFTVNVNAAGEVTLLQTRPLTHPDASNADDAVSLPSGALNLKATVTDKDGDQADASLSIGDKLVFKDDGPAIQVEVTFTAPSVIVDETALGTSSGAISFAGAFDIAYGADGAASSNAVVYSFELGAMATGLTDIITGENIILSINALGVVEGRTAISDDLAFTVSVNAAGEVTLLQSRPLTHPDASNADDAVSLPSGALSLKATVTDKDGDQADASLNIGDKLLFKDDGPSIRTDVTQAPSVEVDETTLGTPSGAIDFSGAFDIAYGADGAASTNALVYNFEVGAMATGLTDTATGEKIVLSVNGVGVVEGRTETSNELAFTVSVSATGEVSLLQTRPLTHPDTNNPNDAVSMPAGALSLKATVTDKDGDKTDASINMGDKLVFKDDGPTLTGTQTVADATVNEANLLSGSNPQAGNLSITKTLPISFGADGAAPGLGGVDGLKFADTMVSTLDGLGLKSSGNSLVYVNTDGHTITATADGKPIFTIKLTTYGGQPEYTFTLQGPLDHLLKADETADPIDLNFAIVATDKDGDAVNLNFTVKVEDDTPAKEERLLETNEDTNVFFSNADVNTTTTTVNTNPKFGSVVITNDGKITYVPTTDYRGEDEFTYTVTNAGVTYERTVKVTIKPVSDAPRLEVNKNLQTNEDVNPSLDLKVPVVKDKNPAVGAVSDYPERLGVISLTVKDAPAGTVLIKGDDSSLVSSGNVYKFVITDASDLHLDGLTTAGDVNVNYVTAAEYLAIKAELAADRHENFKVEVSVDSFEMDAAGNKLTDVNGANSKQTIDVDVLAVTDPVGLKVKDDATQVGVTVAISADEKTADITLDEDKSFDLTKILNPDAFKDLDGSETRYVGFKGLPDGTTINVDGINYVVGAAGVPTVEFNGQLIPTITLPGTATGLPVITITPPKDFSGDLNAIEVILGAKDSDSDSSTANPALVTDKITIKLHVKPVAGDVKVDGVTGPEDTAINFLEKVKVTDNSTKAGTLGEVITQVVFKLPVGWSSTDGGKTWTNATGQTWTLAEPTGADAPGTDYSVSFVAGEYVITFAPSSTLTTGKREDILGKFTITPPAHSSKDIELDIKVTSKDFSINSGGVASDEVTVTSKLKITVTAQGESAENSTNDGSNNAPDYDVKLNPNKVYTLPGEEDVAFNLGEEAGFKLSAGWSNEDGKWVFDSNIWKDVSGTDTTGRSEDTYALFTPYTTLNNDAQAGAAISGTLEGSVFTYSNGTTTFTLPYAGVAVRIPMQYLDSVKFTGPKDWAGVVKIGVQAGTVDFDEDTGVATGMTISGQAWLTNVIIAPKADQVTLKVDAIVNTFEDAGRDAGTEAVKLNINPTSSDASETFNIKIEGIAVGTTIKYWVTGDPDAKTFTATAGNTTLDIENFNKAKQPELTPPKDSNVTINLTVTAESVDVLTYIDENGDSQTITHTDASKNQTLPIEVQVQGVPDMPSLVLVEGQVYVEDAGNQVAGQLEVALSDLITSFTSGETSVDGSGPDGSETVTLRISDLPEFFSLEGAGPALGGSGLTRVWVISQADLATVKIVVPQHYSGTVNFTAQPVVTENDNPSGVFFTKENIKFTITPAPEATLSISSVLQEDSIGKLLLKTVGSDLNEYISAVRIAVVGLPVGITLYADAAGTQPLNPVGGYYTVVNSETTGAPAVYVKGPANYSGSDYKLIIEYKVTDPTTDASNIGTSGAPITSVESGWNTINHSLIFTAITDKIDLALGSVTGGDTVTGVTTLTAAGSVVVRLDITQKADPSAGGAQDVDGSEQFMHVVVSGVPEGVSVKNAIETAKGQWLLTVTGKNFNAATLNQNIEFVVSNYASAFEKNITITTYSKDTGASEYESDSIVDWTLKYTGPDGEGTDLPTITLNAKNDGQQEDVAFDLTKVVSGSIANVSTGDYQITVTVRTEPGDKTVLAGMDSTTVIENGKPVVLWTKTATVLAGTDGDTQLQALLQSINVSAPTHANSNNLVSAENPAGTFNLNINVSVHANGVSRDAQALPKLPIQPATDEVLVTVSNTAVNEGQDIALNIGLSSKDGADGGLNTSVAGWTVVGNKVFIHIAGTELEGGLYADGTLLTATAAPSNAPSGLGAGGQYYQVAVADLGKLVFKPNAAKPFQSGKLDVTAWVEHTENNSLLGNNLVSSGTGALIIQKSNSGFDAVINASGDEALVSADKSKAIKLELTGVGLVDSVGEVVDSAFISGLPSGFTVYIGNDALSAGLANNAGGGTWAIPVTGAALPNYIAVLPPKNWSGTLENLKLTVFSGHTGLTATPTEIPFNLVVTPIAGGITLTPTLSFGESGEKIALNLNAFMKDPAQATGAIGDAHTERTELELSGFPDGAKVLFYTGVDGNTDLSGRVEYSGGTYKISGLTQQELDGLKFVHGPTVGVQTVNVTARTYEVDASGGKVGDYSADTPPASITINVSPTTPTSGSDLFLWTGEGINGFGGEDTVQLRLGDNLGNADFAKLSNIEIINMQGGGINNITGLTPEDVFNMTNSNTLKIFGDSDDTVGLDVRWGAGTTSGGTTTYSFTENSTTVNLEVTLVD